MNAKRGLGLNCLGLSHGQSNSMSAGFELSTSTFSLASLDSISFESLAHHDVKADIVAEKLLRLSNLHCRTLLFLEPQLVSSQRLRRSAPCVLATPAGSDRRSQSL